MLQNINFSEPHTALSYKTSTPFSATPSSPPSILPSAFIEEHLPSTSVNHNSNVPVTVVATTLPSVTQSFALGSGPDTSDENLSDVSNAPCPVSVPHLIWKVNIFGNDEFPIPVDCVSLILVLTLF